MSRFEATALCVADLLAHCWMATWSHGEAAKEEIQKGTSDDEIIASLDKVKYKHDLLHRLATGWTENLMVISSEDAFRHLMQVIPEKQLAMIRAYPEPTRNQRLKKK